MTLLSALAMNACGKEETKEPEKDAPMTSSEYISFKVSASSPSESAVITWEAVSDRIGVFVSEAGTGSALNANAYYDAYTSLHHPVSSRSVTLTSSNGKTARNMTWPCIIRSLSR